MGHTCFHDPDVMPRDSGTRQFFEEDRTLTRGQSNQQTARGLRIEKDLLHPFRGPVPGDRIAQLILVRLNPAGQHAASGQVLHIF